MGELVRDASGRRNVSYLGTLLVQSSSAGIAAVPIPAHHPREEIRNALSEVRNPDGLSGSE